MELVAFFFTSSTLAALCLVLISRSDAFSFDTSRYVQFQPQSNEDHLAKLESDYKSLEDSLLRELATTNDNERAEEIVEDMLEKAADVAAFQRYRMEEIVEEADDVMKLARDDRRRAHFAKDQAHDEAISAAREAAMVEEFGAAYEDLERARDIAVFHSDHVLEVDAAAIEENSEVIELEAGDRKKQALHLLKELKENEANLRDSLGELRKRKNEQAMGEWRDSDEAKAHASFLEKIRHKLRHYSINKHADSL